MDLDLVEPAGVDRQVDEAQGGVGAFESFNDPGRDDGSTKEVELAKTVLLAS